MGQRLNIEIIKDGKTIANCYYHWSAYTLCSLNTANKVIEYYDELMNQNLPDEVLAVKMFENCNSFDFFTGGVNTAGLTKDSYEYMCKKYPQYTFKESVDRNAGLIGVTLEDMINTRNWQEGIINIDLDKKTINAGSMIDYYEAENFMEEWIDEDEEFNYEDLPDFPRDDLDEIPFDEINEVINEIESCNSYRFKSKKYNNEVILLIE